MEYASTRRQRKSWWQIPASLRCPVIGTCLSIDEQRSVLRKAGVLADDVKALADHDVHGLLVQSGGSDCPLARRVQRRLEEKYRRDVRQWGLCEEHELLERWDESLQDGNVDAALWIAATQPDLSERAVTRIFGDVHMLMHQQGWAVRRKLQEASRLRAQHRRLQEKLHKAVSQRKEAIQALRESENAREELELELARAGRPSEPVEPAAECQAQRAKAEAQVETQSMVIQRLREENLRLSEKASVGEDLSRLLQAELSDMVIALQREEDACADCPNCHLCEKRVLLVGGITRLKAMYQVTVEEMGGEFRYHDGRSRMGDRGLAGMISWADVVLCPVDVNSHNACLSVKKACKRMNKPYHMLPGSGVSGVARALVEYCSPAT